MFLLLLLLLAKGEGGLLKVQMDTNASVDSIFVAGLEHAAVMMEFHSNLIIRKEFLPVVFHVGGTMGNDWIVILDLGKGNRWH